MSSYEENTHYHHITIRMPRAAGSTDRIYRIAMKRILIAEDQAAERDTLTDYIRSYAKESGHEIKCTAFSDGADLLEEYEIGTDLILMDIDMQFLKDVGLFSTEPST